MIYCGEQELADGTFTQLWTLKKQLPGLVVKSTYVRATIEKAFRRAKYGATLVLATKDAADVSAVESPPLP